MKRSLTRKIADALRLLFLSAEERRYVRLLRASPEFDRGFYLAANPRLHPLFRRFPERHYVREGEAMGLCPNPGFSPFAYLAFNPDLAARGIRPLWHFIETGRDEGRSAFDPPDPDEGLDLPALGPGDRPRPAADFAVALHLYYPDLWEEFAAELAPQRFGFDLYVTLTGPAAQDRALPRRIRAVLPRARIWALGNRGRDILPFAHLANSGLFDGYRAVLKLHGKVSPHRADGADWRRDLVGGVLGDPARCLARLERFLADPAAGLWTADGHVLAGEAEWGMNRARAEALLARAGILPGPLRFPAGSIYWLKPAVIARLAALHLTAADFEPERGLVEGTTAHALERSLGALAAAAGLELREARQLDPASPPGSGPAPAGNGVPAPDRR